MIIRNEQDYEEAFRLLKSVFDAQLGTEEAKRLDEIVTAIENYENEHYPIK